MPMTLRECSRTSSGGPADGRITYLAQFDTEDDVRFEREMNRPSAVTEIVQRIGLYRKFAEEEYDKCTQDLLRSFSLWFKEKGL